MKRKAILSLLIVCILAFFGGCLAGGDSSEESWPEDYCTVYLNQYAFSHDGYDEMEVRIYLPTREGARIYFDAHYIGEMYDFRGYYTEKDGKGMQATDLDGIFTDEFYKYCLANKNRAINVYPYAIPYDCVITFVSDCGVELDPMTVKCASTVDLPMEGLEKTGYEFRGWSEYPGDWSGSSTITPNRREITLYGAFMAKYLTASYYGYDGWDGRLSVRYDEEFTVEYEDEQGYNFVGYFTEENGQGKQMTDRDGKGLAPWDIDEDYISLYGYYTPADTYTLSIPTQGVKSYIDVCYMYYYGDGEEDYIRKTYADGREIPYFEPKTTPKGYYFAGWCFDKWLSKPFNYTGSYSEDFKLYPKFLEIDDYYSSMRDYTTLNKEVESTITLGWSQRRSGYYISCFEGELKVTYRLDCPYDDEAQFQIWNETTNRGMVESWINAGEMGSYTLDVHVGDIIRVSGTGAVNGALTQVIWYKLTSSEFDKGAAKVDIPDYFDITVTQGSHFTLPVYERLWYEFKGYYTAPDGGGERLTNNKGESLARYEKGANCTAYAYYVRVEE